jgi:hypothetical protein
MRAEVGRGKWEVGRRKAEWGRRRAEVGRWVPNTQTPLSFQRL